MPRELFNLVQPGGRWMLGVMLILAQALSQCGGLAGPQAGNVSITIQSAGAPTRVDSRLLGTNLATWMGPDAMANVTFRARTAASGITVVRMPGGSWSNAYGWLSCEKRANQTGAQACGGGWESWAARPTDFINFLKATGKQGMWVVNLNGTSKEAAAAVAFFNARITDTTSIGVDIHGANWYTAGHWAQLRAAGGNLEPVGIELWGVGNEVYGGKQGIGTNCNTSWGWEDVWTCDGVEYVNGIGSGTTRHEGFIEFRNAMRAIDPGILVGAVGVTDQASWADWGNKVISAAGQVMDFYDVHNYAYFTPPANYGVALADAQTTWPVLKANISAGLAAHAGGRVIPIGVTEHNLFSVWTQDAGTWMTRTVNALFIADSLGQMMASGFSMANQWLLDGNAQSNGTDYGLLHTDAGQGYARSPQYFAYVLWSRFGNQMLPITSSSNPATELSVYAGRVDALTSSVLAINKTGLPITTTIHFSDSLPLKSGKADVALAESLSVGSMTFNGVAENTLADDLSNAPSTNVVVNPDQLTYTFAPYSITLLRFSLSFTPTAFAYLPLAMR